MGIGIGAEICFSETETFFFFFSKFLKNFHLFSSSKKKITVFPRIVSALE
jgi:hypothetical protein